MRSIGSINENEWKGKPARLLGTSWFSRLCLRRRAGGSAERTLSGGILFRKHILMQNELPAVSDRPIQPENLKPVLITRSKVGETRQLEREPGCRGSPPCRTGVQRHCPCLPLPRVRKWVKLASWNANRGAGVTPCRTGVQRHCPCLPLPRVRKWVKLASWNANRGPGALPLVGVTWRPSRRRSEPELR